VGGMDQRMTMSADEAVIVRRLRAFTEWLGPGRKLTQTGRITLADARTLTALLDTGDEIDPKIGDRVFRTKSSEELAGLTGIVEWAKAARLVRVSRGRLVPVKRNAPLLERPLELWDRAFEVFPKLGEAICPSGWAESLLRHAFEPAMTAVLSTLYGGPVQVSELRALAWDRATAPYVIENAPEQHQKTWRQLNDRDTDRALRALEALLGAVELSGAAGEQVARLTPLGLRGARRLLGEPEPGEPIYQIKVTLLNTENPVVWRRLLVSASLRLDRLHRVIQAAMGWQDSHLHAFSADGVMYGEPDPDGLLGVTEERTVTLADVAGAEGTRIGYLYDFGDSWEHEILMERTRTAEDGVRYPGCLAGVGACPPEDCGGTPGYERLREVLADPSDPEHEDMLTWVGLTKAADFDPAFFDPDQANEVLRRLS